MKKFDCFCTEKFINENSDLKLNIFTCLDMTKWETVPVLQIKSCFQSITINSAHVIFGILWLIKKNYPLCFFLFYNPYMHYNFKFDTSKC